MSTGRSRSRSGGQVSGTSQFLSGPITIRTVESFRETSIDVVGNPTGDNPFSLRKHQWSGSTVSFANSVWKFQGWPSGFYVERGQLMSSYPSDGQLNRLMAQSGPLTPKVNLPLFLYELKDVPMMLRHAGDLLHKIRRPSRLSPDKEAASATLAYQFGWKPIIDDLTKLTGFSELVRKRQAELDSAASSKGLQRKVLFDSSLATSSFPLTLHTQGKTIQTTVNVSGTRKSWGTMRWKLREPAPIGYKATYTEAMRNILGLNPGMIPISVWKAIPWTWLVDWFTDISNVLQANYNTVYYVPSSACLMETLSTTYSHPAVMEGDKVICSAGTYTVTSKSRGIPGVIAPSATMRVPFLDSFKLSILGSLAILRIRGR